MSSNDRINATITRRVDVSKGLWIIDVRPDGWVFPPFEPGQYAALGLVDDEGDAARAPRRSSLVWRPYSIASSPQRSDALEFILVHVDDGGLSPRLSRLGEGDRVALGPRANGDFLLTRAPAEVDVVFVATGTGIAPFMSMLRARSHRVRGLRDSPNAAPVAGRDVASAGAGRRARRIAIIHGVRRPADLAYRDELIELTGTIDGLTYLPVVSRVAADDQAWAGLRGRVQQVWQQGEIAHAWGRAPRPDDTHVFMCGAPPMIHDMTALLEAQGFRPHTRFRPGQIHTEPYG